MSDIAFSNTIKLWVFPLLLCVPSSCNVQSLPGPDTKNVSLAESNLAQKKGKSISFLWRENRFDAEMGDSISTIIINEPLCKTLTEPERAALGYVVTFVGSECDWDGEENQDFSNLSCKALTALRLGYQCSETHLGYLRHWFRNDKIVLKELESCASIPYTATQQNTFEFINLAVDANQITIEFSASETNMRSGQSRSWTETNYFEFDKDKIRLLRKVKAKK